MADAPSPRIVEPAALEEQLQKERSERLLLDPGRPLDAARAFLDAGYAGGLPRHRRAQLYTRCHSHWREADVGEIRRAIYVFLEAADQPGTRRRRQPFEASQRRVNKVLDAMKALTNLDKPMEAPCWRHASSSCS